MNGQKLNLKQPNDKDKKYKLFSYSTNNKKRDC